MNQHACTRALNAPSATWLQTLGVPNQSEIGKPAAVNSGSYMSASVLKVQPMMDTYVHVMQVITLVLEAVGVIAILIGVVFATVHFLRQPQPLSSHRAYVEYRHGIGRSTLLGLDLLIAGDIIKTVIVHQTGAAGAGHGGADPHLPRRDAAPRDRRALAVAAGPGGASRAMADGSDLGQP